MDNYTKQLADELSNSGKMPMFEVSVVNDDGEHDWITCDIFIEGDSIRLGVNKMPIDSCLSLDEHLQALHEAVLDSINNGDLWTLAE